MKNYQIDYQIKFGIGILNRTYQLEADNKIDAINKLLKYCRDEDKQLFEIDTIQKYTLADII